MGFSFLNPRRRAMAQRTVCRGLALRHASWLRSVPAGPQMGLRTSGWSEVDQKYRLRVPFGTHFFFRSASLSSRKCLWTMGLYLGGFDHVSSCKFKFLIGNPESLRDHGAQEITIQIQIHGAKPAHRPGQRGSKPQAKAPLSSRDTFAM